MVFSKYYRNYLESIIATSQIMPARQHTTLTKYRIHRVRQEKSCLILFLCKLPIDKKIGGAPSALKRRNIVLHLSPVVKPFL